MEDGVRQALTKGREFYENGDYEKAEPLLRSVIRQHNQFADVHNMLGVICHLAGRYRDAEEAFERALAINPHYIEAALNLSVTYNDRGKYDQAMAAYRTAQPAQVSHAHELDPYLRGKIANMHADVAQAYVEVGLRQEAVHELGRALNLCPTFADLRCKLATVYREMGEINQALAEFLRCKQEKPDYLPARLALGVTLYSIGRKDDAAQEWRDVVAREPSNKLAQAYLRMVERA